VSSRLTLRLKHELLATPLEPAARFFSTRFLPLLRMRNSDLPPALHYEALHLDQAVARLLRRDSNTIDVGCHIGRYLSLFLRCAPAGRHAAIEPVGWKADWLKRKFPKALIFNGALAEERGRRDFEEVVEEPAYSRLAFGACGAGCAAMREPAWTAERYPVDIETLDAIAAPIGKVDLVKLDVEGAEHLVLKGGAQTLSTARPAVIFEAGAGDLPTVESRAGDCAFTLLVDRFGYDVRTPQQFLSGEAPLSHDAFLDARRFPFKAFNYIATPR